MFFVLGGGGGLMFSVYFPIWHQANTVPFRQIRVMFLAFRYIQPHEEFLLQNPFNSKDIKLYFLWFNNFHAKYLFMLMQIRDKRFQVRYMQR